MSYFDKSFYGDCGEFVKKFCFTSKAFYIIYYIKKYIVMEFAC